ncbi:MAG: tRNA-dihydrouridine synthase [Parcubacteria group bacterium]|nr:tRNA-dihydrouridine synthase [Parcubacteria group bacterium]
MHGMSRGFWKKLPKPFFALAPMADVTDFAFREIIAKYGKPDVLWTEFVSADGLAHPKAREKLLIDFKYSKKERPIVAQIFGANPKTIREAAALVCELGFDGVDINMGCPDRTIEKQGAGAALMKNPKLAQEIIYAAKEGAGDLPVSVKTRVGYNKDETEAWIPALLETGIAALTIHARTRKEMSKAPAQWDRVARAVDLAKGTGALIIGNGDVKDMADAKEKARATGADGVMFGRAIFGNPWLFANVGHPMSNILTDDKKSKSKPCDISQGLSKQKEIQKEITIEEKLRVMVEHTKLFEKELGAHKNFAIMKKHYKAYVNGFDGAKELRTKLMEAKDAREVETIVRAHLTNDMKEIV